MEIGVDCVKISDFENLSEKLLNKIFTEKEIEYCKDKKPISQHLAARFAGKEVVMKVLLPLNILLKALQIEILNDENGRPFVNLRNVSNINFEIKISLSHSDNLAIAFAILIEKT